MLWSLLRIALFIGTVALLTLGAGYLLHTGGGIRITVADTEFNLGPLPAIIAAVLLLAVLWLITRLVGLIVATLRFLNGEKTALGRYFDRNRERKGFEALTESITAIASGDSRLAMSRAGRAEKLLAKPELTSIVLAQAADLSDDPHRKEAAYRRLLTDERTRFVGLRGLMRQKLAGGDTATALGLARHAFALRPQNVEVQDTLLRLQAQGHDWKGARRTLAEKSRQGSLPRDVVRRRDAVLALSEALAAGTVADVAVQEAAINANRLSPDLVPAAVLAAQSYIALSNPRLATRVLRKAWEAGPHPDLAAAFAAIHPDETPEERLRRFDTLVRLRPDDPETQMLTAELSIAAGDFPAARRAIGRLAEDDPTARNLALMAAIARGSGENDAVVRGWLTRALVAPRGPQWVCEACGHVHDHWVAVCENCGALDSLVWKRPSDRESALPGSAAMLPMIVGGPADAPAPIVEASPADHATPSEVEAEVNPPGNAADAARARDPE